MTVFLLGPSGGAGSSGGTDFSGVTMRPQDGRMGRTFHDQNGVLRQGTILNWDGTPLAGSSYSETKHQIAPSDKTRYIPRGYYLDKDVELLPVDPAVAGSAGISRSGNVVTLTKTAGMIDSGTETMVIPTALPSSVRVTPGTQDVVYHLTDKYCQGNLTIAGDPNHISSNIKQGVSLFGVVGSYAGTTYQPYGGATSVTPSRYGQTLYTGGKYVGSNITIAGDNNFVAQNIKKGVTLFGTTGTYVGELKYYTTSITPSSATSMTISCPETPYMFGFVANGTSANKIVAGMGKGDSSAGRAYVANVGFGNVLTISWYSNGFLISVASGFPSYAFNTSATYDFWIAYM